MGMGMGWKFRPHGSPAKSPTFRHELCLHALGLGWLSGAPETTPMCPTFGHELRNRLHALDAEEGWSACSVDDGFELMVVGQRQCGVVAQRDVVQTKLGEVDVRLRFHTAKPANQHPRHAMPARVLAMCPSVCVRHSQVGVLSKRLDGSSWFTFGMQASVL